MQVKNLKTYIKENVRPERSWKGPSENYRYWLYLQRVEGETYRIIGHKYFQSDNFWDGSGICPLQIRVGTKKEMIAEAEEQILQRSQRQD